MGLRLIGLCSCVLDLNNFGVHHSRAHVSAVRWDSMAGTAPQRGGALQSTTKSKDGGARRSLANDEYI